MFGLHISQNLCNPLQYVLYLVALGLFYVIYLNMVDNKCISSRCTFCVVHKGRSRVKDMYRLPAAGGAASCLRSFTRVQLPARLVLVVRAFKHCFD